MFDRIKEYLSRVANLSLREQQSCTFCHMPCDRGVFIAIIRAEEGEVQDSHYLCSVECFCDYAEEELIDDRVERAVRDERTFLHQNICPACKRRVRKGLEEGEFAESEEEEEDEED